MAGSQLKLLKEALKQEGLIGLQRKGKSSDKRRSDTEKLIAGIRDDFNRFDQRVNRTKRDVLIISGGKFVKEGSDQHNVPGRRVGAMQRALKSQYNLEKQQKGRVGGLTDRRFGEKMKGMTQEERMLERYKRERQNSLKKRGFSLDDSDDDSDEGSFTLTHGGQPLAIDDEPLLGAAPTYANEDDQPPKRKTKKEVMMEVMAKSKFYKRQRQEEHAKTQDEITALDDDFQDIMVEVQQLQPPRAQFSNKLSQDKEYDAQVRELTYDRRAVPADRTKTAEEIKSAEEERWKQLVAAREARMTDRGAEGDDLDDYWAQDLEDDGEVGATEYGDAGSESDNEGKSTRSSKPPSVVMAQLVEDFPPEDQLKTYIEKVSRVYAPHLAEGNKSKMDGFVALLFRLVCQKPETIEIGVPALRRLANKYNEQLVSTIRNQFEEIEVHITARELQIEDLIFFIVIGVLFSTSDHYHLVVTPAVILINQFLAYNGEWLLSGLYAGAMLVDVYFQYQRFSKRYSPEVAGFMSRALGQLLPEPKALGLPERVTNLPASAPKSASDTLSLTLVATGNPDDRVNVVLKLIAQIGKGADMWRDQAALPELAAMWKPVLAHAVRYYAGNFPIVSSTASKVAKLGSNIAADRKPLALQQHRALAIPTYAPAFDENFNPDKKYTPDVVQQEMNKLKYQYKKERKQTLKDIRMESKFIAGERIKETKQFYDDYHKKMSNIVNTIQATEGREKNELDREKKRLKR